LPRLALPFAMSVVLAVMVGCSDQPGLDLRLSDQTRAAEYPTLVPLSPLLANIPDANEDFGTGTLAARASALRARAARLRRIIVDPTTRARMQGALARHAQ